MATMQVKGSGQLPIAGARTLGRADPQQRLEVTVVLRCRNAEGLGRRIRSMAAGSRLAAPLSREAYAKRFGARAQDLRAVRAFAKAHGLTVVHEDAARRTMVLSGAVAQFEAAFGVALETVETPQGTFRGRTGDIRLPQEIAPLVDAVLGLDDRPVARAHFRPQPQQFRPARAGAVAFTPIELAALYAFPPGDGKGECIAIVELGGGYRTADLETYFKGLAAPMPQVVAVSVDHARNAPTGDPDGPDGEVMLDIEVAGAVAPRAALAVYFAPNTDSGFYDAISTAVHDTTYRPSVISISWGGPESGWTGQSMQAYDTLLASAAAMGVAVCVAAGDGGSSDGEGSGNHVDFPASSPHALACGGTALSAAAGRIVGETVWNDGADGGATGGGVSATFAVPDWQAGLAATLADGTRVPLDKRGVPDVAGDADPRTGYKVRVDGMDTVIGGTSAVAPLWAGLIARINAGKKAGVGLIQPALYKTPSALRDIPAGGSNGAYASSAGWDACTGLGSPNGVKIAALF